MWGNVSILETSRQIAQNGHNIGKLAKNELREHLMSSCGGLGADFDGFYMQLPQSG